MVTTRSALFSVLLCSAMSLMGSTCPAHAAIIITTERGWYDETGFHNPGNTNYVAGQIVLPGRLGLFHNFFVFDLSGVSGVISSASLEAFNPLVGYASPSGTETYTLFDVSTPAATLVAGTGGAPRSPT